MTSQSHDAWQESSVAKFGAVHKKLKEEGKDETTRGESLRELQRFFKEHDKDEGYAGLHRISDEDGTAVWTILKETEVAAQLEKRAGERREEERRRDILVSEQCAHQARTPSEATGAASNEVETMRAELEAARGEVQVAEAAREAAEVRSLPYIVLEHPAFVWTRLKQGTLADKFWSLHVTYIRRRSCEPIWTRKRNARPTRRRMMGRTCRELAAYRTWRLSCATT